MKTIKPLSNRLLVKRSKMEKTKGGIFLPETAQEKPKEGEIMAVGPGKRDEDGNIIPMNVKIGDRVLFSNYSGTEVKNSSGEEDFLILSEDDILGILSN